MHPTIRTLLIAGTLLLCALPAAAQKKEGDGHLDVTSTLREPPFQVYRRAFRALGAAGFGLRAGLIDEGYLMSLPKPPADTAFGHHLRQVVIRLEPLGDGDGRIFWRCSL